ncbi:hypothetical protein CLAIMM_00493 [Cladophialophora immunda]|nr:hypothetical protein CLAIMM_00493 [Cladophialophora immunda]
MVAEGDSSRTTSFATHMQCVRMVSFLVLVSSPRCEAFPDRLQNFGTCRPQVLQSIRRNLVFGLLVRSVLGGDQHEGQDGESFHFVSWIFLATTFISSLLSQQTG